MARVAVLGLAVTSACTGGERESTDERAAVSSTGSPRSSTSSGTPSPSGRPRRCSGGAVRAPCPWASARAHPTSSATAEQIAALADDAERGHERITEATTCGSGTEAGWNLRMDVGQYGDETVQDAVVAQVASRAEPTALADTANWLPVPEGDFVLRLRLYLPRDEVLDGDYPLPPVERTG